MVPPELRRSSPCHQLLKNALLVRWSSCRFLRLPLCGSHRQPMANYRLQRHGAKVLLNPREKEKGGPKTALSSKVESLIQLLDHHLLGQAHAVCNERVRVNTALQVRYVQFDLVRTSRQLATLYGLDEAALEVTHLHRHVARLQHLEANHGGAVRWVGNVLVQINTVVVGNLINAYTLRQDQANRWGRCLRCIRSSLRCCGGAVPPRSTSAC